MYDDLKMSCQNELDKIKEKGEVSKIELIEGMLRKLKIENKNLHQVVKEKNEKFKNSNE